MDFCVNPPMMTPEEPEREVVGHYIDRRISVGAEITAYYVSYKMATLIVAVNSEGLSCYLSS